jgi:hypothetical protein|tara:strand:+ start:1289 stop:1474 length:186 start_codon:yes stop_codon:yes gene_type:complete
MQLTNNSAFDKFLDDEYQSRGYVEARKVVDNLRATIFKNLNDQELEEFRKEFAYALDMTLK